MTDSADRIARTTVLTAEVLDLLARHGQTLAVAESLTGGMLAANIVDIPGASRVLKGGVVAYATQSKASVLQVDSALLAVEGPVHPGVAAQMASNVAELFGADFGIACTGIAGPITRADKPVGLVYIAIAIREQDEVSVEVYERHFIGDRTDIRKQVVTTAIELLYGLLADLELGSGYA